MRHLLVMNEKDAHFRLRLPQDLKKWVDDQARANNRSINAEIAWMLQFMREGYQKEISERDSQLEEIKKIALEALERAKDAQARKK